MIGHAIIERVSVIDENKQYLFTTMNQRIRFGQFKLMSEDTLLNIYANLPVGNPSYRRLMDLLKNPESNFPIIHHCTAGRDRVGIGSMLILLTLGVPLQTVLEDYLLSNEVLINYHEQIFKRASALLSEKELNAF